MKKKRLMVGAKTQFLSMGAASQSFLMLSSKHLLHFKSLLMAFCVLINLLSDTTTVGTEVTHIPSAVVNSLKFILKSSSFYCRSSEKGSFSS